MKIGIIKEGKVPPDERVPFDPAQCKSIQEQFLCEVAVQQSDVRRIQDQDYLDQGLSVTDDVSDSNILFGVKEVPIDALIPDKTYFFFSHTIKEQPYNRDLLRAILAKRIRLIDYECLVNEKGLRLLGFGRYAGIVGAYNGLRMMGLKKATFQLKKAHQCKNQIELLEELKKVKLSNIKICITGRGRVAGGAIEILKELGIKQVTVEDYLNNTFEETVFVQLAVTDYNKRKDGGQGKIEEFFHHPELYESDFMRFAETTDFYIASHYWDANAPFIFSRNDLASEKFNIKFISDISCDIDGPVASTIRPSTIEEPFYGIDKSTCSETDFMLSDSLAVMAVDNLPCELPVDASRDFGQQLMKHAVPALFNGDEDGVLARATIAENGQLTERFSYLEKYVG